ncbi:MAG: hypothetical protein LC725_07905, partial [Lentisphaerae bacterium]|nr:hypothetical protein [Lentisphaerota bacterium]
PGYYAFGKALEDPSREADELEREFIDAAYGEAAPPMRGFFRAMHRRWEVRELFDRRETGVPDRRYRGYSFGMKPGDDYCYFYPPHVLHTMSACLERAKAMALDEKVKARLALVEAEFRYQRSLAVVQSIYRIYRLDPSWEALDLLETAVQDYKDTIAWLMPGGRSHRPGSLRSPYNGMKFSLSSGAPYGWDFAGIRAQGELPVADVEIKDRGARARIAPYTYDPDSPRIAGGADEEDAGFLDPSINAPFDM